MYGLEPEDLEPATKKPPPPPPPQPKDPHRVPNVRKGMTKALSRFTKTIVNVIRLGSPTKAKQGSGGFSGGGGGRVGGSRFDAADDEHAMLDEEDEWSGKGEHSLVDDLETLHSKFEANKMRLTQDLESEASKGRASLMSRLASKRAKKEVGGFG
jgi:hypothetical protein